MANKNTISIELIVNDNGSVTIKQFGAEAEKSLKQAESAGSNLNTGLSKVWMGITAGAAAVAAAWMTIGKVMQFNEMAAKALQAEESFRSVAASAGESADKIIAAMSRASAGTVDDSDLMQKALKSMLQGFNGDEIVKMTEMARVSARMTGEDVKTAYEKITDAISTNMPRALKQYGLITKDEIALVNKAMAAGVEDINLLSIAAAHHAVQVAKMGEMHRNAAEDIQVFNAKINEMQESIGKVVISMKQWLLADLLAMNARLANAASGLLKFVGATDASNTALEMAKKLMKDHNDLLGIQTEEEKKAAEESSKNSQQKVKDAETQLKAEREKLKAIADQAEQTKALQKAYEDLSKAQAKVGEEQLKIAATGYEESLKREGATIEQLKTGLDAYLTTLQGVYTTRIEGEKKIAEAIKNSGGKPEEVLKAQLEALKQEEKLNVDRLAGMRKYYDTLTGLHAKSTEAMKLKETELATLQNDIKMQRMAHENQVMGLREKLMLAQGKIQTDESIYMMKRQQLEREWGAALLLTGDAQVKALESVKAKFAALTGEVTAQTTGIDMYTGKWVTSTTTVMNAEDSLKRALENVELVQDDITLALNATTAAKEAEIAANKKWSDDLTTAMAAAKTEMGQYTAAIADLSLKIVQMEREIAVTVKINDQATMQLQQIRAALEELTIPRTATVMVNQVAGAVEGGVMPGMYPMARGAAFDRGNVIPFARGGIFDRPTIIPMARGYALGGEAGPEAIMPLARGSDGKLGVKASGGGQVITIAPGAIVINGANKSGQQLAREIVRYLPDELRRLQAVGG